MRFMYAEHSVLLVPGIIPGVMLEVDFGQDAPNLKGRHQIPASARGPLVASIRRTESILLFSPDLRSSGQFQIGRRVSDRFEFESIAWPFDHYHARSCIGFGDTFLLETVIKGVLFDFLPHSIVAFHPETGDFETCFCQEIEELRKSKFVPARPVLTGIGSDVILSDGLFRCYSHMSAKFMDAAPNPDYKGCVFGSAASLGVATIFYRDQKWMLKCLGAKEQLQLAMEWDEVPWTRIEDVTVTSSGYIVVVSEDLKIYWQKQGYGKWSSLEVF